MAHQYRLRSDRFALSLIGVFAIVTGLLAAGPISRRWFPARYLRLRVQGFVDPRCSFALARTGFERLKRRREITDRNRQDVRQVRREGGVVLFETARGPVWVSPRDSDPASTASTFHEASTIRWNIIDGLPAGPIQAGDIVIDAGAHVGESTYAAIRAGAARVVSVEPDADNLAALRRNLAREIESGEVVVIEKGVYDREGALTFVHREGSRDGFFVEGPVSSDALPVTTIDRIVRDLALSRVDFIKMDIEGSEVAALTGAADTLRRFAPKIAVGTYHRPDDLQRIEQTVMTTQPEYTVMPSFCLDEYAGHEYGKLFPFMLYFSRTVTR